MTSLDTGRALIIDDNETFRRGLGRWVRQLGYEPMEVGTAAEALRTLTAQRDTISVVLLDLRLPDVHGHAVLREMRRLGLATPVIIMSGHAALEDAVLALREHASDFLQKPFGLDDLGSALSRATAPAERLSVAFPASMPGARWGQVAPSLGPSAPPRAAAPETSASPVRAAVAQLKARLQAGEIDFPVVDPRVQHLQRLLGLAEVDIADVIDLLGRDPALASSVLGVANSAYYRRGAETKTLREACVRLGAKRVLVIAMKIVVAPDAKGMRKRYADLVHSVWRCSLATSRIAAALAAHVDRVDAEEVQIVALLHNIGETLVLRMLGEIDATDAFSTEDIASQVARLHEPFGQALAKRWELPRLVVNVAGAHHDARRPGALVGDDRVRALVLLAWKMAAHCGYAAFPEADLPDVVPQRDALGLSSDAVERILADVSSRGIE